MAHIPDRAKVIEKYTDRGYVTFGRQYMRDFIYQLRIFLALVVLNTACGSNEGGGSSAPKEDQPNAQTEQEPLESIKSFYVDTTNDLQACEDALENAIAYVKAESQFYGCDGLKWAKIDVKGENGLDGASANVFWNDPVTDRLWYVRDPSSAFSACADSGSSQVTKTIETPSLPQIQEAIGNGLFGDGNVKVYYISNKFLYSEDPSVTYTASDYTGSIWAFTLCLVVD